MTGPKKIGFWSDLKAVNIGKQRGFLCNGHKYRVIKTLLIMMVQRIIKVRYGHSWHTHLVAMIMVYSGLLLLMVPKNG